MHFTQLDAGRVGQEIERLRVLHGEALEDAAHDGCRRPRARAGRCSRSTPGFSAACRPARRRPGRWGRRASAAAARTLARSTSSSNERSKPSSAQARRHSCSSHRPVTFRSTRTVPATPPSFVRFAAYVRSSITGRRSSSPTSDHVPALMNADPWTQRDRRDRRGGVVRRAAPPPSGSVEPGLLGNIAGERRESRRRRHHLGQQRRWDPQPLQEVARPGPRVRVEALRRRRVRVLGDPAAAQPVVHEVGDHQQRLRGLQRRVVLGGHRRQLEDRVDRHQLDAGALVQLARGHRLQRARPWRLRAACRGS